MVCWICIQIYIDREITVSIQEKLEKSVNFKRQMTKKAYKLGFNLVQAVLLKMYLWTTFTPLITFQCFWFQWIQPWLQDKNTGHTCTVNHKIVLGKHIHIRAGQAFKQALYIIASLLLLLSKDCHSWLRSMCLLYCKCKSNRSYNAMLTADAHRRATRE